MVLNILGRETSAETQFTRWLSKLLSLVQEVLDCRRRRNFLEDGFDVTTYESRDYVGGLWKDSKDSTISVHSTTIFNTSKYCAGFSDFPLAETDDDYPTAYQLHNWLVRYAEHFNLLPRIKLGTKVLHITRTGNQWALKSQKLITGKTTTEYFDKVCIATGTFFIPKWPNLEDLDKFTGKVIHSIDYHTPEDFKDQRVLIIGMHATAQDVTNSLSEAAKHVYLAHRGGLLLMPRFEDSGATSDQAATLRFTLFVAFMYRHFPTLWNWLFNRVLSMISTKAFPSVPEEWGLRPAPHVAIATPLFADTLWPLLQSKFAEPIPAIRRITGPRSVELTNGRILQDIDSIIYCTGYHTSLPEGLLPQSSGTESIHPYPNNTIGSPPNLYRNIFPLHPDPSIRTSLAFLGHGNILQPGFIQFELNAMAISQVWLGKTMLPPHAEMLRWHENHLAERQHNISYYGAEPNSTYYPTFMNMGEHFKWVDEAAGTGISRNLGTGMGWGNWRAWKLWWVDRELYKVVMGGIFTPFIWRLFDGGKKRKAMEWGKCRAAILRQNELALEGRRRVLEGKKRV
ncbi:flavin-containing monooxygenase-like protein [Cadophora sp. MPI-SDFR-AT-0126]|nr:flavin-containing monooxygenase-like protein [Leotiomycetes sp. MPI-SDFR-AT-0126]